MDEAATPETEVSAAETAVDRDARPWLAMLDDAKVAFQVWQDKSDSIDKLLGDLKELAQGGTDREFQIFWANLEVLKPTIYSRPPVPVVTPRFKDRKPLPRRAADVLERALVSDIEADDVHETLKLARDDLAVCARGVVWCRYAEREGTEAAIAEHVDREDFRHEPARKWSEVGWVAKRAWLTRKKFIERFGDIPQGVKFAERDHGSDKEDDYKGEKKAEVWEIWSRAEKAVVWVSPGVEEVLDIQPPMIEVKGFFPCPRPAYGTVQRRTLLPVPDFLYYRDQVEEINELTARISALAESLRVKGFYDAGTPDIGEAVEAALKAQENNAVLVPVPGMAALGGKGVRDVIVWLPFLEVAQTIKELLALRRQLIEDVYEITGLSDIMRGATQASETATAQQLKAQYGSVRVRERQQEMERLARDVIRIKAEIMAENFAFPTLLEMSQVDDLPDAATVQQQAMQAAQQAEQQQPGSGQAVMQQTMQNTVTQEAVAQLLAEQRVRPFVLKVETDSTIFPDENAEKQRRSEFITAVGGFMAQAIPLSAQVPDAAPLAAKMLKFVAGAFRAGRELDAAIDEFADKVSQQAKQPREDPAAAAMQAEAQAKQAELQMKAQTAQIDAQAKMADAQMRQQEAATKVQMMQQEGAIRLQVMQQEAALAGEKTAVEIEKLRAEIQKIMAEIGRIGAQAEAARMKPEANDGADR